MSRSNAVVFETANERFKRGFGSWMWVALMLATAAHFALFQWMPAFGIEDVSYGPQDIVAVEIPDEIEVPPAPATIARPAAPVIADALDLSTDLTIAPTTFEANPVEDLPAPPARGDQVDLAAAPAFTPMTVAPRLLNGDEMSILLVRYYPPLLRDAGIGGTVQVWFFIDETGRVVRTLIHESSGYDAFDAAALRVADRMRFSPAYNCDRVVPVWVSLAVRFEVTT